MSYFKEGEHWVIGSVGIIFVLVGSSKWLYDVILLNSFTHWKVYLVMILVGAVSTGYMRLEKALGKIIGRA